MALFFVSVSYLCLLAQSVTYEEGTCKVTSIAKTKCGWFNKGNYYQYTMIPDDCDSFSTSETCVYDDSNGNTDCELWGDYDVGDTRKCWIKYDENNQCVTCDCTDCSDHSAGDCTFEQGCGEGKSGPENVWDNIKSHFDGDKDNNNQDYTDDSRYGACIYDCNGKADGDYSKCDEDCCNIYVSCSNGRLIGNRPCPGGTIWNDAEQICDYTCSDKDNECCNTQNPKMCDINKDYNGDCVCTSDYTPTCCKNTDGYSNIKEVTYFNKCEANCNGATTCVDGACDSQPNVCDCKKEEIKEVHVCCNGEDEYNNKCLAKCAIERNVDLGYDVNACKVGQCSKKSDIIASHYGMDKTGSKTHSEDNIGKYAYGINVNTILLGLILVSMVSFVCVYYKRTDPAQFRKNINYQTDP